MSAISAFKQAHRNIFWVIVAVVSVTVIIGVKNVIFTGSLTGPTPVSVINQSTQDKRVWKATLNDQTEYFYFLSKDKVIYTTEKGDNDPISDIYANRDSSKYGDNIAEYSLSNDRLVMHLTDEDGNDFSATFSDLKLDDNNNIQANLSVSEQGQTKSGYAITLKETTRKVTD